MKLTGCVKFFLFSLVGVIALVFIYWGGNTSLQDIWINYSSKPEPWVGIFTACVLGVTAYASYKAGESAKIAGEMLELSSESSRKDDFIKQFTLLLEQHNRSHDALAKSIDSNDGQLISDSSSFIQWDMTLEEASKKLFQHYQYSSYMRILYRNLKYINENFYLVSNKSKYIEEKKQYTAILRSIIRNDILFLVAINAKNKMKIFRKYEKMLKDFSFFEHIIIDNVGEKIKFNIDGKKENFSKDLKNLFKYHLNKYLMETVDIRALFKMYGTGDKMILSSSFVYEVMKEFSTWQYDLFKSYLIKSIRNCYFDLKRLGENDFFSNDCFYIWKGVVVGRETQMFSQFDHIELGSKKILNNSVPISLLKNSESILNGKIYISDECIDLKNGIFFQEKGTDYFRCLADIQEQCRENIIRKEKINSHFKCYNDIYFNVLNRVIKVINGTEFLKKMNEKLIVINKTKIFYISQFPKNHAIKRKKCKIKKGSRLLESARYHRLS